MFERILIALLYIVLGAVAAFHKLNGSFIPKWFAEKFEPTFLNAFPGGLHLAFGTIIAFEILIPLSFIISLFRKEFQENKNLSFTTLGFRMSLILFLILFFGSFLTQDYENGALDFIYFVTTIFLMRFVSTPVHKQIQG
jgi:hypothetical protein